MKMKRELKRRIYYISIITSLVSILVSAVIINRTLVNTPQLVEDNKSNSVSETASVYMAYIDEDGDVKVGIAEKGDKDTQEVIAFLNNITLLEEVSQQDTIKSRMPEVWAIMYDAENRMSGRVNFYDGGKITWYNDKCYHSLPEDMNKLVEYCNLNIKE